MYSSDGELDLSEPQMPGDSALRSRITCLAQRTARPHTTWGSTTNQILALREHLAAAQVTCAVMEATGDYWKPFYYLLEDLDGVEVMLVNAREAKNLPGRKTDVADATWLAQLGAHGLVRASFVPPAPIRELRDLTRTRTAITRERSREVQRLARPERKAQALEQQPASTAAGHVLEPQVRPHTTASSRACMSSSDKPK